MTPSDAWTLAPLAGFYAAAGRTLPPVEIIGSDEVPVAYRELLSAPRPLTPRLEDRHGEALALRVLERRRAGDDYARRIVLVRGDGVPVVLGPSMFNFSEATRLALEAGAAVQAGDAAAAIREAVRLLADAGKRAAMGQAGIELCAAHRGATQQHLLVCEELLKAEAAAAVTGPARG